MIDFKWLLLFIIFIFLVGAVTFLYSIISYRQRRRKPIEIAHQDPPVQPKTMFVSSSTSSAVSSPAVNKSLSSNSSQLTDNDVVYLDKLFRTASNRTMWKDENFTVDRMDKPRKVPSGQTLIKPSNSINT